MRAPVVRLAVVAALATAGWSAAAVATADDAGESSVGRIELLRPRIEPLRPVIRADGLDVEIAVAGDREPY